MRKFRVGAIGTGGIFRHSHAPGWKALPDVEVVAVCDVDEQAARPVAQEVGAQRVFTDFRDLVKLDLDAVDICTPNRLNTPAVLAALYAGRMCSASSRWPSRCARCDGWANWPTASA